MYMHRSVHVVYVRLARTVFTHHTVYDRMCDDFPAENTVCTPYICMVLANPMYTSRLEQEVARRKRAEESKKTEIQALLVSGLKKQKSNVPNIEACAKDRSNVPKIEVCRYVQTHTKRRTLTVCAWQTVCA